MVGFACTTESSASTIALFLQSHNGAPICHFRELVRCMVFFHTCSRVGARWCALATTAFVTLSVGSGHANRACSNRIFAGCLRSATPPLRPCCAMLQRLDVFGAGNVESVAFQQSLFRINDAGLADTQWRLPADFQITEQYLAPDGAPIVRACVRNSPTYEQRWYRLRRKFGSNYTGRDFERVRFSPWNPDIEINTNVVSTIRVVRNRIVIANYIGGAPSVNRVTTFHLVDGSADAVLRKSLTQSGALGTTWQPKIKGDVYKLIAARVRFRAGDTLNTEWGSALAWPTFQPVRWGQFGRHGIFRILDAGSDGVFFIWEDGYMNGSNSGVRRVSRSGTGAELPLPRGAAPAPGYDSGDGNMLRDPKTGDI